MSGPITNIELGQMQHREYETNARQGWYVSAPRSGWDNRSAGSKWIMTLSGSLGVSLLVVLMLV